MDIGFHIYLKETFFFIFVAFMLLFVLYWAEVGDVILGAGELNCSLDCVFSASCVLGIGRALRDELSREVAFLNDRLYSALA